MGEPSTGADNCLDNLVAGALQYEVEHVKTAIEELLGTLQRVLDRSNDYIEDCRGAIKFLRPIVDIAKRPCDQDYENIMEGIKDIARDLDDVLKMDEKSVTDNK